MQPPVSPAGLEGASSVPIATRAPEPILCVDDDPNILASFERQFRKRFTIETATGAEKGLEVIAQKGPFAVVVSDLHMPGMDGIEFLNRVRSQWPQTIRIMLTGQADLSTAIAAVNQGNIFRFLVKPCTTTILGLVIEAALEQHRLQMAERQLTEQTLLGCVNVLVDILGIVQPDAFSRAVRLRRYVQHLAGAIGGATTWEFEAAAMLSQIGWITLPRRSWRSSLVECSFHRKNTTSFWRTPLPPAR